MKVRDAWYTFVRVGYDLFLKLNPRKLAAHAVIRNEQGEVLLLHSRYGDVWMLPGGGVGPREHVDEAVVRECREELGVAVTVEAMTGFYYVASIRAYVAVFRCHLADNRICLSHEHNGMRWTPLAELPGRTQEMARDALSEQTRTILRTLQQ